MRFVERWVRGRRLGVNPGLPRISADGWWRPLHVMSATRGGGTVLLDPVRGRYHTLNDVGARVWGAVAERDDAQTIVGTPGRSTTSRGQVGSILSSRT